MKEIKIILTLDLDPDLPFNYPDRWKGLQVGSLKLAKLLRKKFKRLVPISLFVRIDDETKKEFSSYDGIIKKNKKLFFKLKNWRYVLFASPFI